MTEQPFRHQNAPAAPVRQDDRPAGVRRRAQVRAIRSAPRRAVLLVRSPDERPDLAQPESENPTGVGILQTQRDETTSEDTQQTSATASDSPSARSGGHNGRPDVRQIAERVYQLLRQDLRLERERSGW